MRFLVVLLMLALVPTVAGQGVMPRGSLEIEVHLEDQELDAGDMTNVTVGVIYHCPTTAVDVQGQYVAILDVQSTAGVWLAGAGSKPLGDASCLDGGSYFVAFPLQVSTEEWVNGTMQIHFVAELESADHQTAPEPADVEYTVILQVDGPEPELVQVERSSRVEAQPLEANVPGPALPLLAAGLFALARRRQG